MHEVIWCVVNNGFSEYAMENARETGAKGGTIIRAKGTANPETEKIFGLVIEPEKEIILIIVDSKIRDKVLHALYKSVGQKTKAQGFIFSMPISKVIGLKSDAELLESANETVKENKNEEEKPKEDDKNS